MIAISHWFDQILGFRHNRVKFSVSGLFYQWKVSKETTADPFCIFEQHNTVLRYWMNEFWTNHFNEWLKSLRVTCRHLLDVLDSFKIHFYIKINLIFQQQKKWYFVFIQYCIYLFIKNLTGVTAFVNCIQATSEQSGKKPFQKQLLCHFCSAKMDFVDTDFIFIWINCLNIRIWHKR